MKKPQPDAKLLGEYNVKYVISPYPLLDKSLIQKEKTGNLIIYQNKLFVPRIYEIYTSNFIRIKIDKPLQQLIIPEVYSPGWNAYLNGEDRVIVQETPNSLRAVDIIPGTKFVDFKYEPYKTTKN